MDIVKYPDVVGQMNLATHIGWLTALWWTSTSVLLYFDCVFDEAIDNDPKRWWKWERKLLYSMHGVIIVWWLSCVRY